MLAVGVGDENLPEGVLGDDGYDGFDTSSVQLVEDVVQEQQRFETRCPGEELVLRQAQGDGKCLLLALRGSAAHGHSTEGQHNVVAVWACRGVAEKVVARAVAFKEVGHRHSLFLLEGAAVFHACVLGVGAGDGGIIAAVYCGEAFYGVAAGCGDVACGKVHGTFDGLKEEGVGGIVAQEFVALLEGVVVADEVVEIARVALTDNHVDEATAVFAGSGDEVRVGRGDEHSREEADVLAQPLILLAAALEGFAAATAKAHVHFLGGAASVIAALQEHEVLAAARHQRVLGAGEAAAEAEVIDGVEEVALAHAVVAEQAVELVGEGECSGGNILEVGDGETFEEHG